MRLRLSARCAAGVAAAAFLLGLSVRPAHAANILITQFDNQFNGATDVYAQMAATLQADGHTTSLVDARVDGALAAALGGGTFDSVFLWDLTASLYLDGADLTALAGFYGTHSSLVIDTRSYGYYFQGTQPSEVNLLQNVAANLTLAGGGVWVGTDHDPSWTNNGNAFLGAIGVNTVTGSFGDPVNLADPTSVLLAGVTPTDLWAAGQTVGQAPLGLQPNGTTMFFHFGHQSTARGFIPYISASFDLAGPVDPGPSAVPEPGTWLLLTSGLGAIVALRRKKARR